MPKPSSIFFAGLAAAVIGGTIAWSIQPAASSDKEPKTTATQQTAAADEAAILRDGRGVCQGIQRRRRVAPRTARSGSSSAGLDHVGKDKTQQWLLVRLKQPDQAGE